MVMIWMKKSTTDTRKGLPGTLQGCRCLKTGRFSSRQNGRETYTVYYSDTGYAGDSQPDIYTLLEPVPDHMLKVRVLSDFIDMMGCTHYVTPDYRAHEVEDEDHYDTDD